MTKKIDYLLIDPFASHKSGVTAYTKNAKAILEEYFSVEVLSINPQENIEEFRKRVAHFVRNNKVNIVEAPETRAASKYIDHPRLHIRLHGSKTYCNYLQHLPVSDELICEEQREMDKAYLLSAPSSITVEISKLFFKNLNNVKIIPNPIYFNNIQKNKSYNSKQDRKIFFIGRGDYLKGIEFLLEIIKKKPNLKITLVGDEKLKKKFINHPSFSFINGEEFDLERLTNVGDIILVPSIFETWSMVAGEAILNKCQIILWEHCGICQFSAPYKYIYPIAIWNISAFAKTIEDLIFIKVDNENITTASKQTINKWNNQFLELITNALLGKKLSSTDDYYSKIDLNRLLLIRNKRGNFMRLKKKVMKFFRNPALFFKDSKYFSPIYFKIKKYNFKFLENNTSQDYINKEVYPSIEIKKLDISPSGFITFPEMDAKKAHLRTMILMPERHAPIIGKIIPFLHRNRDFLPLRKEELLIYCYDDLFSEIDPPYLLERLNIANRERLSNIRNIFVFDDTENFSLSLHYSNYIINVIQIIPEQQNDVLVSNVLGYYLIHKENIDKLKNDIKRKTFIYNNELTLSLYIRKTIQEILPRDINLLLPVISSAESYRIDLFKNKDPIYDVKLYLTSSGLEYGDVKYHNGLCMQMAELTKELYVTEKTFLKYQNLLTNLNSDKLADFYLYSSRDGLRFDVEYK